MTDLAQNGAEKTKKGAQRSAAQPTIRGISIFTLGATDEANPRSTLYLPLKRSVGGSWTDPGARGARKGPFS